MLTLKASSSASVTAQESIRHHVPEDSKFYSYYFFVTAGTTSKAHHSSLLYGAEILPSASILPNSASHTRVPAGSQGKTATNYYP
jgi:hypothetical protein